MDEQELRQVRARVDVLFSDLMDELRSAVLVRDVHVEARILARGVAIERLGHGHIGEKTGAGGFQVALFVDSRQLESFAKVIERYAMPRKMVPDSAALELLLGVHGRSRSGEQQPAGRGAQSKILFLAVSRQQGAFRPDVGID